MNNFGVIEIASAKTTAAPGWAYVPDTRDFPGANALQPANRKRARNGVLGGGGAAGSAAAAAAASVGELSARQEAKIQKDIEALEKDVGKDNSIPVPAKSGKGPQSKHTPGVRKILQSQKTFANHLDDFSAMQSQVEAGMGISSGGNTRASLVPNNSKRPPTRKDKEKETPAEEEDDPMTSTPAGPILTTSSSSSSSSPLSPTSVKSHHHPSHSNPLLMSRVPGLPTDEELRKLLAHPPLTYYEARAKWEAKGGPARVFCEVCGYWGRVKCIKCGTRVCALDCLETHREECITRYGM